MAVLTAAVVLLAAIVVLNLAVTVALLKRLRSQTPSTPARNRPDGPGGLPIGTPAPDFTAESVDGTPVDAGTWAGQRTLIGFFATECPGCVTTAPGYAAKAATLAADGIAVLTFLETTPSSDTAPLAAQLSKAGPLVRETRSGPVMKAFGAQVTPSFFVVGADGRIEGKGLTVEEALPAVPALPGTPALPAVPAAHG